MGSAETGRKLEIPSSLTVSEEGLRKWLEESVRLQLEADGLQPSIHSDMDMMMTPADRAEINSLRERSGLLLEILIDVVDTDTEGLLAAHANGLYHQAREEKSRAQEESLRQTREEVGHTPAEALEQTLEARAQQRL